MHTVGTIPRRWSVADSREIYAVRQWGGKYFDINESGHLIAYPQGVPTGSNGPAPEGAGVINLKELVEEVRQRGIGLPLLIRFPEILRTRIVELNEAFRTAITEYGYKNIYKGVYPIKVNQQRHVCEQIANLAVGLKIIRAGAVLFSDSTSTRNIVRPYAELIAYLGRDNLFPAGVVLLTGTGIVPPDAISLQAGDEVVITIEGIGELRNPVVLGA